MGGESPFVRAMEMALRLLAVRARSTKEIRSRLRDKGIEGPIEKKLLKNSLILII